MTKCNVHQITPMKPRSTGPIKRAPDAPQKPKKVLIRAPKEKRLVPLEKNDAKRTENMMKKTYITHNDVIASVVAAVTEEVVLDLNRRSVKLKDHPLSMRRINNADFTDIVQMAIKLWKKGKGSKPALAGDFTQTVESLVERGLRDTFAMATPDVPRNPSADEALDAARTVARFAKIKLKQNAAKASEAVAAVEYKKHMAVLSKHLTTMAKAIGDMLKEQLIDTRRVYMNAFPSLKSVEIVNLN
jgi:hypothetical protein